ncbi:HAAS signaling domain-containing protein [Embleya sp. NPDC001921]
MKDTALHPVAADYRAEVARILADLPVTEAEEILDDVEVNLSEVLAELDDTVTAESLRARLGTPHEYAAELRAAAGYPPLRPAGEGGLRRVGRAELLLGGLLFALVAAFAVGIGLGGEGGTQERWWVFPCLAGLAVEAVNALWLRGRAPGLPEVAALSVTRRARALGESLRTGRWAEPVRFLVGLQSAWWVARALVIGVLAGVLADSTWWGVAGGVAALVFSLWLAPRARQDRRLLWMAVPFNALVLGAAVGVVGSGQLAHEDTGMDNVSYTGPQSPYYGGDDGDGGRILTTQYGRPLENIYPFDAQGRPLTDVLLFDQDGKQLGLNAREYACAQGAQPPVRDRQILPFPQPRVVYGPNGGCRVEEGAAPFTIAIPIRPGQDAGPNPGTRSTTPPSTVPGTQPPQGVPSVGGSGAPSAVNPPGSANPGNPGNHGNPTTPVNPTTPPVPPNSAPPEAPPGSRAAASAGPGS